MAVNKQLAAFKVMSEVNICFQSGGSSNMVGLICPLVKTGLTELPWAPHYSLIANRYVNFGFKLKSKQ